jgi:16S rRNA (guanine527-N7)-methyltransferase
VSNAEHTAVDGDVLAAIQRGAERLSVPIEDEAAHHLAWLVDRLCHWNRAIRIMGRCTVMEAVERHVLDGLALLRVLDRPEVCARTTHWFDVGAGAGLPGLVLAIARPQLSVTMVEPVRKKIAFAQEIAHALSLSRVQIRAERLEDVSCPITPTGVLSRATFAPQEWLERGRAWVGAEGIVLVMMGPTPPEEVLGSAWIVDRCQLPESGAHRTNTVHCGI